MPTGSNYHSTEPTSSRPIRVQQDDGSAINSFGHFASSYTRAQSFLAIEPLEELNRPRAFFMDEEEALDSQPGSLDSHHSNEPAPYRAPNASQSFSSSRKPSFSARFVNDSMLNRIRSGSHDQGSAICDDDEPNASEQSLLIPKKASQYFTHRSSSASASYLVPPQQGTTLLQEGEAIAPGTDTEPVIVRTVEDTQGNISTEVVGQSTVPQTIFNSINTLIGIGLLSLPLGFKYAGWVVGSLLLVVSAAATQYTALLLSRCMDTDPTLVTYADIAYAAFGPKARVLTSLIFTFELMGINVSLVVLFADSLNALFPHIAKNTFKYLAFFVLSPLCFLPLRALSVSSILGITSTLSVMLLVFFDGLYKTDAPGSLWSPEKTYFFPKNWMAVSLAIGIFMAPWGGHAVFPNIYRDMRHPQKYRSALSLVYKITFPVDLATGVLGFLMFGKHVDNEITKSILFTPGYPANQDLIFTSLITLIPLSKTPLTAHPVITTVDALARLGHVPLSFKGLFAGHISLKGCMLRLSKAGIRLAVVLAFVFLSIVFPDFDRIIAFFGASLCVTICVAGPIAFYLKIYGDEVPKWEKRLNYFLFVVFVCMGIVGTIGCFIPVEQLG